MVTNSLSGWKTKGIPVAHILLIMGVCLLISIISMPAFSGDFSFSLNTKGEGAMPCSYNLCSVTTAAVKINTPNKISYEFKGTCLTTQEGCKNTNMIATADWNRVTKVASEGIGKDIGGGTTVGLVNTQSNCSDNPWTNKNAACNLASPPPSTMAGPFPKTALLITDAQRQSLIQQEKAQMIIPTPPAPVIQSPSSNQAFLAPATVQIKVLSNCNVAFEFQRAELVSKPNIPNLFGTQQIVPSNMKTAAGVTTGDLSITKPGKWRFRSQCIFPNAPWSDWREFVVETVKLTPGLQPTFKPVK